jgi:very-short-patch-repair endonuclease
MTSAETAVWNIVRRQNLGWRFRRQEPIGPYIVDFVCISRRLVVEMDGTNHGGEYDRIRDDYLRRLGFRVLRFPNDALADRSSVAGTIRAWLEDLDRG